MSRYEAWIVSLNIVIYGGASVFAANGIDFKVTTDCFSKYIWRGQNLDDKSVFQPSVSLRGYGFTGRNF